MTERSKVHDWKSCVGQLTEGSNPSLSAISSRAARGLSMATPRSRGDQGRSGFGPSRSVRFVSLPSGANPSLSAISSKLPESTDFEGLLVLALYGSIDGYRR